MSAGPRAAAGAAPGTQSSEQEPCRRPAFAAEEKQSPALEEEPLSEPAGERSGPALRLVLRRHHPRAPSRPIGSRARPRGAHSGPVAEGDPAARSLPTPRRARRASASAGTSARQDKPETPSLAGSGGKGQAATDLPAPEAGVLAGPRRRRRAGPHGAGDKAGAPEATPARLSEHGPPQHGS